MIRADISGRLKNAGTSHKFNLNTSSYDKTTESFE